MRTAFLDGVQEGEEIHRGSGLDLMEDGFQVEIPEHYDGRIYEIGIE